MAKLHLLRRGTGEARLASSFNVSLRIVERFYGAVRVHTTKQLPTIDTDPASAFAGPHFTVIELVEGEVAFGEFKAPGFNFLLDVDPIDAHKNLVEKSGT